MNFTVEDIAKVCHETNKTYCEVLHDYSQMEWDKAPDWQRKSAINGVQYHLDNPLANPIDSHANWLAEKIADGWIYGPTKDVEKKTHPCVIKYHELPVEQRIKDQLFINVIRAMTKEYESSTD